MFQDKNPSVFLKKQKNKKPMSSYFSRNHEGLNT